MRASFIFPPLSWVSECMWFCVYHVVVVQSLSCVQLFVTLRTTAPQSPLSFTTSWSLLKLMSFESERPSKHLILCHTLLLLLSIFSSIRVFSNESALHIMWPKYWHFSISPSNKYSGLISFRMDWLDHLAVQGTLKSLLQHHSSKASILLTQRLGENICKWCDWQGISLQNLQTAHDV